MEKLLRPSWVEIDLDAIKYNAENIKKLVGDCEPIAVMKADAYGFGIPAVAKVLKSVGYKNFAVATLEEAIELREVVRDDMILVLGIIPDENAEEIVRYDITVMLSSYENAAAINEEAARSGKTVRAWIALDTGMSRIGYCATELDLLVSEVSRLQTLSNIELFGLHSHFATSDEADKSFSYLQLDRFNKAYEALAAAGIRIPNRAIANSAAIIDLPETLEFEMCRPGFILYGVYPSDDVHKERLPLKSPMTVKTKVSYVKTIHEGDTVGYGRKFTAPGDVRLATLPIGFADGLPRAYSPVGLALVNGSVVHIAGNVCMDQCMIDVSGVEGVEVGTEVILMGTDGKNTITPEYIAESISGMAVDELTHGFSQRMPRIYV